MGPGVGCVVVHFQFISAHIDRRPGGWAMQCEKCDSERNRINNTVVACN